MNSRAGFERGCLPLGLSLNRSEAMNSSTPANDDDIEYTVVVNDEEQYSIWPTFRAVPAGWREVGVRGPKAACLAHIETVWTDMRPASLRRHMDAASQDA